MKEKKGPVPVRPIAKSKAQLQDDSIMGVGANCLGLYILSRLTNIRPTTAALSQSGVLNDFIFQMRLISSVTSSRSHRDALRSSIVDTGSEWRQLIKWFASSWKKIPRSRRLSSILDADSKSSPIFKNVFTNSIQWHPSLAMYRKISSCFKWCKVRRYRLQRSHAQKKGCRSKHQWAEFDVNQYQDIWEWCLVPQWSIHPAGLRSSGSWCFRSSASECCGRREL